MNVALAEYEYLLNLMIDEAAKQHRQIVFINETAIWKDSLPQNIISTLWQGGTGQFQKEDGHRYYTPRALRHGLELYNNKLREVCNARKVKLIDIDTAMAGQYGFFYDDCHFTIAGAKLIGQLVYKALKAQ
jgi:hypothetical protein